MKRTAIVILFIFSAILIFSLEEDNIIGSITISGLKRTKESVIYNLLQVEEGDKFYLFDEEDFTQEILKTGILRPGEITYNVNEGYIDINIEIQEKWTLLPIPIVSISGENQYYGFVLLEQNFLGLRKLLFIQSAYSTLEGVAGGIMYMDMNILPNELYLLAGGFLTNNDDDSYMPTVVFSGIGKDSYNA